MKTNEGAIILQKRNPKILNFQPQNIANHTITPTEGKGWCVREVSKGYEREEKDTPVVYVASIGQNSEIGLVDNVTYLKAIHFRFPNRTTYFVRLDVTLPAPTK